MTRDNIEGKGRGEVACCYQLENLFRKSEEIKGRESRNNQHLVSLYISNLVFKGCKECLQRCIHSSKIKYILSEDLISFISDSRIGQHSIWQLGGAVRVYTKWGGFIGRKVGQGSY